ncbi:DNA-directed RNA polymeras-like protein III subunit Rpc34 [Lindgomyces ingoldianus]|uniref:DNA-directed RNA polymeras-like protein III subunit Rpc34 n=1 Tax=Lindgomyces ingoldianus TaxID=673940 RepID=A0ACB6QEF5_9PLEO|nr:DNA-directed RNA polymeras-like protein III subunit Rpc34 [Lindgomyces ingoldianus]KAF2465358.1 DNA-directed RNA polymeras-like protein III subunit Rpc34 [Lindgomyces ingoldianus]
MPPESKTEPPPDDESALASVGPSKVDALYSKCAEAPQGTFFIQRELASMQIAESTGQLLALLQELTDRHLMKSLELHDGQPCWVLRTREEAEKLRQMSADERLLYQMIDDAQNDGVWSKALRARAGLTPQRTNKVLKALESKGLVKAITNVKVPNKKMYLLKDLEPSPEIAGGPWQTDGEYDLALIHAVSNLVEKYVREKTWKQVPVGMNRLPQDIEENPRMHSVPRNMSIQLYPSAKSILRYITEGQFIKEKRITEGYMEELLDMMTLDGRLEKMSATTYRTARDSSFGMNGFVEAPCGTCPVFDLCGNEGEITASTCAYFTEWIDARAEDR